MLDQLGAFSLTGTSMADLKSLIPFVAEVVIFRLHVGGKGLSLPLRCLTPILSCQGLASSALAAVLLGQACRGARVTLLSSGSTQRRACLWALHA